MKKLEVARMPEPEYILKYRNSKGEYSERQISDLRYSSSYKFHAYCHTRKEERTFMLGSVVDIVDIKTGKSVESLTVRWGDRGKTRTLF
jgi:hypothetical protein